MSLKIRPKKEKNKIKKLIEKSDSENDDSEHELSFYLNDRVKLMKEVLKIIKPKKIKSMAPDCIKDLDIEEINSMLLEELLGISNKRLKYIFSGQNLDEDSSSTDPEEEKQPIDVISLDDVSDDDFVIEVDSEKRKKKKHGKIKEEAKVKKIKKEKHDKKNAKEKDGPLQEENLMSVLELLELQARARAIRSQLMLEANKKSQPVEVKIDEDSDEDAVIIEVPKNEEIVINSSDSDSEQREVSTTSESNQRTNDTQKKKITLIRDRFTKQISESSNSVDGKAAEVDSNKLPEDTSGKNKPDEVTNSDQNESGTQSKETTNNLPEPDCTHDDEVILIMDHEEMEGIGD